MFGWCKGWLQCDPRACVQFMIGALNLDKHEDCWREGETSSLQVHEVISSLLLIVHRMREVLRMEWGRSEQRIELHFWLRDWIFQFLFSLIRTCWCCKVDAVLKGVQTSQRTLVLNQNIDEGAIVISLQASGFPHDCTWNGKSFDELWYIHSWWLRPSNLVHHSCNCYTALSILTFLSSPIVLSLDLIFLLFPHYR